MPLWKLFRAFEPANYIVVPEGKYFGEQWAWRPKGAKYSLYLELTKAVDLLSDSVEKKAALAKTAMRALFVWTAVVVAVRVLESVAVNQAGLIDGVLHGANPNSSAQPAATSALRTSQPSTNPTPHR